MLQHFAKHQRIMAKKRQENIKLNENDTSPQQAPHNEHVTGANKEQNTAEIQKKGLKLIEESTSQHHLKQIPLAPRRRRPFIDKFNKNWMVKPPKLDDKQKQTDKDQ